MSVPGGDYDVTSHLVSCFLPGDIMSLPVWSHVPSRGDDGLPPGEYGNPSGGQTNTCENITFPQLRWRAVNMTSRLLKHEKWSLVLLPCIKPRAFFVTVFHTMSKFTAENILIIHHLNWLWFFPHGSNSSSANSASIVKCHVEHMWLSWIIERN